MSHYKQRTRSSKSVQLFATISVGLIFAAGCKTVQPNLRTDADQKMIEVYSTQDQRTPLAQDSSPGNSSSVVQSMTKIRDDLRAHPRDTKSWVNLANLCVTQNQLGEAETAAKRALRLDIHSVEAKKVLAQVAIRRNQYSLAALILNGFGIEDQKDPDILNMSALVAMAQNRPTKAMNLFQRALKIDPGNVAVRLNLGVSYLKYRQLQSAATQFERVLKTMPENREALLHLAIVKSTRGNYDDARQIYEDILAKQKNNPLALYNLAVLDQRQGFYDDALENVKKYLRANNGKSQETSEAFALLDRIKDLRSKKDNNDGDRVDDDLKTVARKTSSQPEAASASRQPAKSTSEKKSTKSDSEIEALEKELIQ